MTQGQRTVVVVGGGTAGWLSAAVIAAERRALNDSSTAVVLIESPDIPTIGVGEGTWPSLRQTLQRIGLPELDLLQYADASFKQGTRFVGWAADTGEDQYFHPFSLPVDYAATNLAPLWLNFGKQQPFAEFVTPQAGVMAQNLAPKQPTTPEYAFAVNYGYHLDAGKFAERLKHHAVQRLGVKHVLANVAHVVGRPNIEAVELDNGDRVAGTLFVDCTGQRALLLNGHYDIDLVAADDVLFNDTAVAVQVPHAQENSPIVSSTISTATDAGWIWDIALQSRRGVGHVFSSRHTTAQDAQALLTRYIAHDRQLDGTRLEDASFRTLRFSPGYRERFWVNNCVAIGLSAGFVEPLEASAIALIEQSAAMVGRQLPVNEEVMAVVARGFNEKMHYHWQRIIEFLKLHYALSTRSSPYWQAHRERETWPQGLADKLQLWQQQSPYHLDAPMLDELFPSASYQFVLYGMGFRPKHQLASRPTQRAEQALDEVTRMREKLLVGLPDNRQLIQSLLTG